MILSNQEIYNKHVNICKRCAKKSLCKIGAALVVPVINQIFNPLLKYKMDYRNL